jgi:hypothetical protein
MTCSFICSNFLLNIKQQHGDHWSIVLRSSVLMPLICKPLELGACNTGNGQIGNIITIKYKTFLVSPKQCDMPKRIHHSCDLDLLVYEVWNRIPNKNYRHVTLIFKDSTSIWPGYESSPGMMTGSVTTHWPFCLATYSRCQSTRTYYVLVIPSANVPVNWTLCRIPTVACVCGWMFNIRQQYLSL